MTVPDSSQGPEDTQAGNILDQATPVEEVTQDTGNKAPYQEYLDGLPASVVPLVEPIFKKWDSDTGRRFQEVHSEYEPLKPWKEFATTSGASPEDAQRALILLNALQENPQRVWETLGQQYNFGSQQTEQGQPGSRQDDENGFVDPSDLENDPRFAGLQNMTRTMAEYLVAQEQQKQQAALDAQVDAEMKALTEKFGEFDEKYVLTQMINGATGEQAVKSFQTLVENAVQARQRPAAPTILGGTGGGVPTSPVDVSKASSKDVKSLVADMLRQSMES